ncbi:MAG: ABC transporter permease [Planktomarina sp.]
MFQVRKSETGLNRTIAFLELLYNSVVRNIRRTGGKNPVVSLIKNMSQTLMFVGAFFLMFEVLGMRGAAIRGDFLLYILSGIFVFMTHVQALGAVQGAEGPASPMMKHAPMSTLLSILAAALQSLYTQVLTLFVVLLLYHVAVKPLEVSQPMMAFSMVLLAWFSGATLGMVFLSFMPWAPGPIGFIAGAYTKIQMFASGKMFVANAMPTMMLNMVDWNPLFHIVDQSRGFAFINYSPRNSDVMYPVYAGIIFLMIGLIAEHYTRKYASESWSRR